jgi:hypothetical protein
MSLLKYATTITVIPKNFLRSFAHLEKFLEIS